MRPVETQGIKGEKMDRDRFNELVERHGMYLRGDRGGKRLDLVDEAMIAADLSGKDLSRSRFESCSFYGCQADRVSFKGAGLKDVVFNYAAMSGAVFDDAWLEEVCLDRAVLRDASFRNALLGGCSFKMADCTGADFAVYRLAGADFSGARLRDVSWEMVVACDVSMRGADIDFARIQLSCGALGWRIDSRIASQLAYHFCSMKCDDPEFIAAREALLGLASKFHRSEECGILEYGQKEAMTASERRSSAWREERR
jgi:hypothetical protein